MYKYANFLYNFFAFMNIKEPSTMSEVMPESTTAEATTTSNPHKHHKFLRPPRDNCTPPAIEQFPPTLMNQGFRKVRENF